MKLNYLSFIFLLNFGVVYSQVSKSDFVFTIETSNPGISNFSSFHLNLSQVNVNYLVDIDWNNNGVFDTLGVTNSITHDYGTTGRYTIRLKGQFPKLQLGNYKTNVSDRSKLISVDQWGTQSWSDVSLMFINCDSLLTTSIDTPDFSGIWTLGSMFAGALKFNGPINHWDISTVTTTNVMFYGAESFNQPLNNWDVSSVQFASRMFTNAKSFNSSVRGWNWASAIDFSYMFEGASSFNQSINTWIIPACTSLHSMFLGATNYNQPMDSLDVSNVIDFSRMFENASSFNQNLSNCDFSNSAGARWFLDNSNMSVTNYDALLNSWFVNYSNRNLNVGSIGLAYCNSDSLRSVLVSQGWFFNGDTLNCLTTSVNNDFEYLKEFKVYPNPVSHFLNIDSDEKIQEPIFVYNQIGELVIQIGNLIDSKQIDVSNFPNGIYFIRKGSQFEKVVIQH